MACMVKFGLVVLVTYLMTHNVDLTKAENDAEEETCGPMNERVLYNNKVEATPLEYPWIGRLLHEGEEETTNTKCLVSLISKQHVLMPSHCIFDNGGPDYPRNFTVQMRLWKKTRNAEKACNHLGYCTQSPIWYTLTNLKVHPYYDKFTKSHTLAIGTLNETVEFSKYLQPICLQAKSPPVNFIGKYFFMGGFRNSHDIKTKTGAVILSPRYCNEHYKDVLPAVTRTELCGHQELNDYMNAGSPIMGINVVDDVMKSLYLVGYLITAASTERPATPMAVVFVNIQFYISWIKKNLIFVESTTKNATSKENNEQTDEKTTRVDIRNNN